MRGTATDRAGGDVVGVDAGDGEVVHRLFAVVVLDRGDLHEGAGRGRQTVPWEEVARVDTAANVGDPERVPVSHDHCVGVIRRGWRS